MPCHDPREDEEREALRIHHERIEQIVERVFKELEALRREYEAERNQYERSKN